MIPLRPFTSRSDSVTQGRCMCEVCTPSRCISEGGAKEVGAMAEFITRLERRVRAQTDEQLDRDAAFAAIAGVCCETPLTEGSAAHSLVDYVLSRLRRRLLASGSRLSLTPTFRWSDFLDGM